ncbi:MAG TPA: bacteriohopanetetrol glucosamine biosynthesis glycosyltransferase HpnI [Candidatus Acidoferrum sp.]|nr:bacteriohopanetetrol glucosamine biosynthesis glycosyltransferase HpnI [Candidatus Acidoferrum sp.]
MSAYFFLRSAVLLVALAPFGYYLLAIYCGWDYFRKARTKTPKSTVFAPAASILKPVRGLDRDAYANFASFCNLDYPEYEILFAVEEANDPIVAVIEQLRRDFPERAIRLFAGVAQPGANHKVNNLCKLVQEARYELLAISDSDIRVQREYLREVVAPFADTEVGAVTAFFRAVPGGTVAADLEALVLATETVPNALVARKIEGRLQFLFGWTMATTKSHLDSIHGFEAMMNFHSDDFELGSRMAARGFRIELMNHPVQMMYPRSTMRDFFQHELRWAIGLRNVRPSGYAGLLLTFGFPWAILAAIVAPSRGLAGAYLALYFVLRLALVWTMGIWGLKDEVTRKSWWLVPLRDLLNFGVWAAGFFTNKITWRGLEYRVEKGLLIPSQPNA